MRRFGALVAALALLGGGDAAAAATLKAEYQLQGSRASAVAGAPDLADVGPGNQFETETVDGVARQVLAFPQGGGVSLATAGLVDVDSHSIVMTFRMDEVAGYRRLLDFSGGTSDSGLYDLGGRIVMYPYGASSAGAALGSAYVQVTLTSEATFPGFRLTTVYVGGLPVASATTADGFGLGAGELRFFKDNVSGPAPGEESAGALACVLLYEGALTATEVGRQAADSAPCPAPRPAPPPPLGYETGTYEGTTSQRLSISFTVDQGGVEGLTFGWRARCADGRIHTNGISLGGGPIDDARFSLFGILNTGGRARVSGRLADDHAGGRLSRWDNSAFDTICVVRGIRWSAHLVSAQAPPF